MNAMLILIKARSLINAPPIFYVEKMVTYARPIFYVEKMVTYHAKLCVNLLTFGLNNSFLGLMNLWVNSADNKLMMFFLFFPENKI